MRFSQLPPFFFIAVTLCAGAPTEYFVARHGTDDNDGRRRATAFGSVQRGVDALQPGDTLTILPGEYHESVQRMNLGSDDAVTTIRAEIAGTAVLRGDLPAPPFKPFAAAGAYTLYVAELDPSVVVRTVNELDTLTVLQGRPNLADLQFTPGVFYQDLEAGRLYLTTVDNAPVETHAYSLSVRAGHGLGLTSARREVGPRRVVVEGLAVTGFNAVKYGDDGAGIALDNARGCIVRDCRTWLNGWGIRVTSEAEQAGSNVIERCAAWANDSMFANSRIGGLIALRHRGDVIRDSTAFLNANCGIYLREDADPTRTSRLQRNLAWGNRWDVIIKGNAGHINVNERSVATRYFERENPEHCLFMQAGQARADGKAPGTIILSEEADVDPDLEFADPENRDYRLQATSRFRGAGPGGSDRGPFPYRPVIFYVAPGGDDAADGLSTAHAWRTLARGLRDLKPGDTLYLAPGTYHEELAAQLRGEPGNPVSIRGRGKGPTHITGTVQLADSRHARFERLQMTGATSISNSTAIEFDNCWFAASGTGLAVRATAGLRVTHCGFAGFKDAAIALQECARTELTGNLYDNHGAPAVRTDTAAALRYTDYNAYRDPDAALEIDGMPRPLAELREGRDRYSTALPATYTARPEPMTLTTRPAFAAAGPLGHPFGPFRRAPRRATLRVTREPYVHSHGATTADIEWGNLLPARIHLAWGPTAELEHRDVMESDYFGSYSLTGLEPGTTYHFRIEALEESRRHVGQHDPWRPATIDLTGGPVEGGLLTFTTLPANPPPTAYWVAPGGDDTRSGLDRDNAWRTLQHAADRVRAGDTVWIGGGTYEEEVRVRASGAAGAPITFRCAPWEQVILSAGERELGLAFGVHAKHHLRFDGMYLVGKGFALYRSSNIELSRMFAGRYSGGYAPALLAAHECRGLSVRNSVSLSAKSGPSIHGCRDYVRIEHCVFFRNMIRQLTVSAARKADVEAVIARNIFTDGLAKKFVVSMLYLSNAGYNRFEPLEFKDNCFFPRRDPEAKSLVNGLTVAELDAHFEDHGSLLANPMFKGLKELPAQTEEGRPIYPPDRMSGTGAISLDNFFATHPELVKRGIGLQPEAFTDFHFNR